MKAMPEDVEITPPIGQDESRVRFGKRVRELRKAAGKTLAELSVTTGLSNSSLSKIENGAISISFDNLAKLAASLGTDLPGLFAPADGAPSPIGAGRRSVTRRGQGDIYDTPQYRFEMLQTDMSAKRICPIIAVLRAHALSSPEDLIGHPGEEFAYVLEGVVEVHSEFYAPVTLNVGDSIYFDSNMRHALISTSDADARILWMSTAPELNLHGLRGTDELAVPKID
jgi:transcriptional regulator with XRE-family HTH domain